MKFEAYGITDICADYNPSYDPDTANNGGNYWQFDGSCSVELADGTIINAQLDDSSCGDFGRRSQLDLQIKGRRLTLWEDEIDGRQEEADEENAQTLARLERLIGFPPCELVNSIVDAIRFAAHNRYLDEHRKEKET